MPTPVLVGRADYNLIAGVTQVIGEFNSHTHTHNIHVHYTSCCRTFFNVETSCFTHAVAWDTAILYNIRTQELKISCVIIVHSVIKLQLNLTNERHMGHTCIICSSV